MFEKKEKKSVDDFWNEYEISTGEKVIERSLGKYIKGWDEFDEKKYNDIWGLVITTSGGFRFHHFPKHSWIDAFTAGFSAKEQPKEKTIFIPNDKIFSVKLIIEKRWWVKLLTSCPPRLVIKYNEDSGSENAGEKQLIFEIEHNIKKRMD
ncbi:MAG: hypothetical protein FWC21_02940 [Treponema sp.]|nr:hypothetical protein [Treponema sp.]